MARTAKQTETKDRRDFGTTEKLPSGRYRAKYKRGGVFHYAPETFTTKRTAQGWLNEQRKLIDYGDWTPPAEQEARRKREEQAKESVPTVAAYVARYVESRPGETTRVDYRKSARYITGEPVAPRGGKKGEKPKPRAKFGLGDIRITELTREHYVRWWESLPRDSEGAHTRACHKAYQLLASAMTHAAKDGGHQVEPVYVPGAGKPSAKRRVEALTLSELYAIADAAPEQFRLAILLAGHPTMALRSGEVRGLRRCDIDGTVVHVWSQMDTDGKKRTELKTKDKGRRTLAPSDGLMKDIRAHLSKYVGPDGLLFFTRDGKPISNRRMLEVFKEAMHEAAEQLDSERLRGLIANASLGRDETTGYVFHDLRHSGLTEAAKYLSLPELQTLSGHTSIQSLMIYINPGEEAKHRLASIITQQEAALAK